MGQCLGSQGEVDLNSYRWLALWALRVSWEGNDLWSSGLEKGDLSARLEKLLVVTRALKGGELRKVGDPKWGDPGAQITSSCELGKGWFKDMWVGVGPSLHVARGTVGPSKILSLVKCVRLSPGKRTPDLC